MYFDDENFVIYGLSEQERGTFTTKARPKMRLLAAVLAFSLFTTLCAVSTYYLIFMLYRTLFFYYIRISDIKVKDHTSQLKRK